MSDSITISRRTFSRHLAGAGALTLSMTNALLARQSLPRGQAKSCILLWLGGGMCHVDTFDPKQVGDPKANKPGSAYPSITTAIPGVRVCQHLHRTARLLEHGVLIRTMNHPLQVDHADSTNLVKTGRLVSGTVIYPSLGSVVSHELGPSDDGIPTYVVMGLPNVTRGPGFLGSRYGYLYLTDVTSGPMGLRQPFDVSGDRQKRRTDLLNFVRKKALNGPNVDTTLADYDSAIAEGQALVSGSFPRVFDLTRESDSTRTRYGGPFGQRCLLSRRLIENGVRFVEVAYDLNFKNGTGWDTHRHGQANQHLLIDDLDQSLSALVTDLKSRRLLDQTLVVVATEFGRPPEFDGQGGRGHQSSAFSVAMFGGSLQTGQVVGTTDELGRKPIGRSVSVPDFHATILHALGIDPAKELFDGDRPIPITDHGAVISELFARAS